MKSNKGKFLSIFFIAHCVLYWPGASISLAQDASSAPELFITPPLFSQILQTRVAISERPELMHGESGEFLRDLPGVTAGRMGGHGMEPVIHGQQQTQLNVTSDGAFVHGGCPNRMDPPSASINYLVYDELELSKGYQTVQNGAGGSGGSLEFKRNLPALGLTARGGSSFSGNSDTTATAADVGYRDELLFSRLSGQFTDAGNYQDGAGEVIRSSYRQYSVLADAGRAVDPNNYQRVSVQYSETEDALFPGAGMDSPYTRLLSTRFDTTLPLSGSVVDEISAAAYVSLVDHLMDNYSLREQPSMLMRAPSSSDTFGGRLVSMLENNSTQVFLGLDSIYVNRSAKRFAGMMNRSMVTNLTSILWPDTAILDVGFFSEMIREVSENDKLKFGLRLDTVKADIAAAEDSYISKGAATSPNALYRKYYGVDATNDVTETNPSGLVQYQRGVSESINLVSAVSYVSRTADASERSIASEAMTGNWVGNPAIDPEQHREVRGGVQWQEDSSSAEVSLFYNSIEDYILRDLAKGQPGILVADGSNVYRNIDARLSGVDLLGGYALNDSFRLNTNLSYTYGKNEEQGIALPQIPPLSGSTAIEFAQEELVGGIKLRYAMNQNRVDDDPLSGTGRDLGSSSGYATLDLYGVYEISKGIKLKAGVNNLLDKEYANHLNRANAFEAIEVRVNEPGRAVYAGLEFQL